MGGRPADLVQGSGLKALQVFLEMRDGHAPTNGDLYQYIKDHHADFNLADDPRGGDDTIHGGTGDDIIYGQGGNDTLYGDDGNDAIFGEKADDILNGGAGVDVLDGGDGRDELYAGTENDYVYGGAGNDLIRYLLNDPDDLGTLGGDLITGFEAGKDKIDLYDLFVDFGISDEDVIGSGILRLEVSNGDTLLQFDKDGGGDSFVTLATLQDVTNVTLADLIFPQSNSFV